MYKCLERILVLQDPLKKFFDKYGDMHSKRYLSLQNLLMLRLFLCLTGEFQHYIIQFQQENLDILSVANLLKELVVLITK